MKFDLRWNPEWGLGDVVSLLGFMATVVGLCFAVRQLRQSATEQRAQFLLSLTERYFADSDTRKFYYKIDYNDFVFDLGSFSGSDQERWLDQLIYTFDTIGHMVRIGAISSSEASIFAFQASRVLNNPEVKKYLNWLDGEYKKEGRPTPSHSDSRYLVNTLPENAGKSAQS